MKDSTKTGRQLAVLTAGMFAVGSDSFVVAGVLPQIARAYEAPTDMAWQMAAIYALGFALLASVIATLTAGIERKRLLIWGLVLFVLANLGTIVSTAYEIAIATRFVAAIGSTIFITTAMGELPVLVPEGQRKSATPKVIAGLSGATALGAMLGTAVGHHFDWRLVMVVAATFAAAAGIGVIKILPGSSSRPGVALKQQARASANPMVGLMMLSSFLAATGIYLTSKYLSLAFGIAAAGNGWAVGGLLILWSSAGVISNLAGKRFTDTVASRKVILLMLLALTAIAAFGASPGAVLLGPAAVVAIWGTAAWGYLVVQLHRMASELAETFTGSIALGVAASSLGISMGMLACKQGLGSLSFSSVGIIGAILIVGGVGIAHIPGWRMRVRDTLRFQHALKNR